MGSNKTSKKIFLKLRKKSKNREDIPLYIILIYRKKSIVLTLGVGQRMGQHKFKLSENFINKYKRKNHHLVSMG